MLFTLSYGYSQEITQEIASKGVGFVYEMGDEKVRDLLVKSLVGTLTDGRKLAPQSVTGDTQLFEAGSLGTSPEGSTLTTYQSILSLASDMNQPDLVYKFMNLASHNALWDSRRGASLGFQSISHLSKEALRPFFKTLIPKLYRFQYDPNPKVAESMKSIWQALVSEPKKTVHEYFDSIMKELLEGMGSRTWRTREAWYVKKSLFCALNIPH